MIFFLYGEDTYRSRQKLKELKDEFIKKHDKSGLNIACLDGEKLDIEKFRETVSSASFLASKKLVVIENLLARNKGQKIFEEINNYLYEDKELPKDNSLIFFEEIGFGGKKQKGKKDKKAAMPTGRQAGQKNNPLLINLLKEKYQWSFEPLDNADLVQWIKIQLKKEKASIDVDALQALVAYVGNDLWQLNQELEKLLAYCRPKSISHSAVKELVKAKFNDNIFHLVDAIGTKNKKLALKLIRDQLNSGHHFDDIFPMIIRQFRILLQIKEKVDHGYPITHLGTELGLHSFVVEKALIQALRYKLPQLKKIYSQLLDIDVQRKTGFNQPEILLDVLIATS